MQYYDTTEVSEGILHLTKCLQWLSLRINNVYEP